MKRFSLPEENRENKSTGVALLCGEVFFWIIKDLNLLSGQMMKVSVSVSLDAFSHHKTSDAINLEDFLN